MQRVLLMKNSNEFDMHFINPSFMKSTYEISCDLLQKIQKFDYFKEEMNQNNEKLKTEMSQNNEQLKIEMNQNNEQLKIEMSQNNEQLKAEMNQNNEQLKTEMSHNNEQLKTEMSHNNEQLKTEMSQNNEQLKAEMNQKFEQQSKETQQLKTEIQSMKERFDKMNASIDKIYPVGSIYMSVKDTNPENIFGGRWERWGKGRVPVGVSESGTFNSVEKTGGSEMHQLTLSEIPTHEGHIPDNNASVCTYFLKYTDAIGTKYTCDKQFICRSNEVTLRSCSLGGGNSHNNLQPYITCFMWKRVV